MALVGVALAALAGVWWGIDYSLDRQTESDVAASELPQQRVAVLSFENISSDTADTYLARGISEEIALRLGDFPELKIASRGSVERLEM